MIIEDKAYDPNNYDPDANVQGFSIVEKNVEEVSKALGSDILCHGSHGAAQILFYHTDIREELLNVVGKTYVNSFVRHVLMASAEKQRSVADFLEKYPYFVDFPEPDGLPWSPLPIKTNIGIVKPGTKVEITNWLAGHGKTGTFTVLATSSDVSPAFWIDRPNMVNDPPYTYITADNRNSKAHMRIVQ